jgi:hypothetical protein
MSLANFEEFLDPALVRFRLIAASVYLAIFELLKSSILDHPRAFFADRFTGDGPAASAKYKSAVLSRNKNPVYASLAFLREEFHVISESDASAFERVKRCRNHLAHRLFHVLASGGLPPDFEERLGEMVGLVGKIEEWWFRNVEVALMDDVPDGVDLDGALSGKQVMIAILARVALSPGEDAEQFLRAFRAATGQTGRTQ